MTKQNVTVEVESNIKYEIEDQPLSVVIEFLKGCVDKHGDQSYLSFESDYGCIVVTLNSIRLETDAEEKRRLDREAARKKSRLKSYLTMKKKNLKEHNVAMDSLSMS